MNARSFLSLSDGRFHELCDQASGGGNQAVGWGESPDLMGTVCRLHQCARFVDEVPLIGASQRPNLSGILKHKRFPNSWNFVRLPLPHRKALRLAEPKTVAVRYCPECRGALDRWIRGRLVAPSTALAEAMD